MAIKPENMSPKRFYNAKLSGKQTSEEFIALHRAFIMKHVFLQPIIGLYDDGELMPTPTLQACQSAMLDHSFEGERIKAERHIARANSRGPTVIKGANGETIIRSPINPSGRYTITVMANVRAKDLTIIGVEVATFHKESVIEGPDGKDKFVRVAYPGIFSAKSYSEAEGLADRRLFAHEDSVYAIIENNVGETPIVAHGKKIDEETGEEVTTVYNTSETYAGPKSVKTTIMRGDAYARIMKQKKGAVCHVRGKSTKTLKWIGKASQTRVVGPRG